MMSEDALKMTKLILAPRSGSNSQPAVRFAVNQLRRECIAHPPGTLLGQEEELLQRFGISRPTLRQAAALVGMEQLMEVRRGPGGGYFTTRPDISGVVHMAAIWLQLQKATVGEILVSTSTIRAELAPLAARNIDEATLAELKEFLAQDQAIDDGDYGFALFLKAELKQNDIVGRASGNRVLHLYMQISLDLVGSLARADDILLGHRSRYLAWRYQRNRMLQAIVAGDPEIARLESERCGAKIQKWLEYDMRKKKSRGSAQ